MFGLDTRKADEDLVMRNMSRYGGKWYCLLTGCKTSDPKKHNIMRHVYKHMGLSPFKCVHCPFITQRKDLLVRHFKSKHPNLCPVSAFEYDPYQEFRFDPNQGIRLD